MGKDKRILLAFLILIGLMVWLLVVSYRKDADTNNQIIALQTALRDITPVRGTDGITPVKGVDYTDGKDGSSCGVQSDTSGATISCTDGTSAQVSNGKNGKSLKGDSAYTLWIKQGNKGSVSDFLTSLNGNEAIPAREVELHCNPLKLQNEWRYIGTSTWRPLDKVLECIL